MRVKINLTKWQECRYLGETPQAFIDRMEANIELIRKNTIEPNKRRLEKAKKENDREWLRDYIKYNERTIKRYKKEIEKAKKELTAGEEK